jgi:hypothetical protein
MEARFGAAVAGLFAGERGKVKQMRYFPGG